MGIYVPNPANNPTSFTMAVDGDDKPTASVRVAMEGIADKVANAQWPGTDATKKYPLLSRTLTRSKAVFIGLVAADWTISNTGALTNVNTGGQAVIPLDLPDGAVLDGFQIWIDPSNGHAGGGPATAPICELKRIALSTGTVSVLANPSDPTIATSLAAYEARHSFGITTGQNETIDVATYRYCLVFTPERGANNLAGTVLDGATVKVIVTAQDPGAA